MVLTLAAGLLASCSKDDAGVPEPGTNDGDLVEITPEVAVVTKSGLDEYYTPDGAVDGTENLTLYFVKSEPAPAGTLAFTYGTEQIAANRPADKGDETPENPADPYYEPLTFETTMYYPVDGSIVRMWGWYPEATFVGGQRAKATWTFDGSNDIIIALGEEGSNVNPELKFDFEHILTQLQFMIHTESDLAAASWGKVKSITLKGENNTAELTLLMGDMWDDLSEALRFSNPTADFPLTGSFDIQKKTKAEIEAMTETDRAEYLFGSLLVEPKTGTLTLYVTTEKSEEEIRVEVAADAGNANAFKAGYATRVYLNFQPGEITATLVPTDWRLLEDDAQDDVEVGENRSYVVKEMNYIVNRNMFGDAVFDDASWSVRPNEEEGTWTGWNNAQRDEDEHSVPAILEVQAVDQNESLAYEDAVNACSGLGEGWRLPTITELELIYLYNEQLATPMEGVYWSATVASAGEEAISKAYTIDMETGESTSPADATVAHKVRCVRDVEMSNE